MPHNEKKRGGYTMRPALNGPLYPFPPAPGKIREDRGPRYFSSMVRIQRGHERPGLEECQSLLCLDGKRPLPWILTGVVEELKHMSGSGRGG